MNHNIVSEILDILKNDFPNSTIKFESPRNDGRHFELTIESPKFKGLNSLQKSRIVHESLKDYIGTDKIHALSMNLTEAL